MEADVQFDGADRRPRERQVKIPGAGYLQAAWTIAADGMVLSDPEGIVLAANPAFLELVELSAEEVVGHSVGVIFPAERRESVRRQYRQLFQSRPAPSGQLELVLGEREEQQNLEIRLSFVEEDGERAALLSLVRDVTVRRQMEERLRESEANLHALFDSSPQAHYLLDKEYQILAVNKVARLETERIWGQAARPGDSILEHTNPANRERFRHHYERCLRGEAIEYVIEVAYPQGERRWYELRYRPVYDNRGEILGVSFGGLDITTRKRSEAQLKSALQEKEFLLKEVYHRVKNNLQVITSLLGLQAESVADSQAASALREGQDRVRSMALVHEQLYQSEDLSSIDMEHYLRELSVELVHAHGVEANTVRLMIDVPDVQMNLNTALPCGLIVNELLSNALVHAFPELQARQARGEPAGTVRVKLVQIDGEFRLTVVDDGVGLPPALDVDEVRTLGLQLVSTLTRQLRGTLEVERDEGTCFNITFGPVSEEKVV